MTGIGDTRASLLLTIPPSHRNLTHMEETLFTKIIARKIPAKIAYEDDQYIVIHDISPQAPVHVLVIPKKVIPTLNDLAAPDAALVGGMFLVAAKVMKELGQTDYRTVFNCGPGAQQTVFHLHLHVLAGRAFTWPPG
jgi:histidine triad (HIT) family protein